MAFYGKVGYIVNIKEYFNPNVKVCILNNLKAMY